MALSSSSKALAKGPTPSDGTVPLSARRNLSLPAIGRGASADAVSLLSTSVAEEELIASERLSVAVSAKSGHRSICARCARACSASCAGRRRWQLRTKAKEDKLKTSREMRADMDKKVGRDLIRQIAASDISYGRGEG